MKTFSPTGGLNTTKNPRLLSPEQTPDCENILYYGGEAGTRGGFTPLSKDRMLGNAVRNIGYRTEARLTNSAGSSNGDFLVVPGCMTAGHRSIYDDQTAISFDLFFEVAEGSLIGQHGGNSETAGAGIGGPAPFTIRVRPILSKGPVKRSAETSGTLFNQATITWNTTASSVWGSASGSGMPFCLYMANTGTGTAPVWVMRLAAHVLVAGSWTLQTVSSTEAIDEGGRWHIIGAISGTRMELRMARIRGSETLSYSSATATFNGTLATNQCPIQVFDCPQQFIEATNVGSGTQRPGLNFGSLANGGYWNACKRAEGTIEDIAIWSGDRLASSSSALDRSTKLDLTQVSPINYWPMLGDGTDYVVEATGRGNHLFFVPRGPITDLHSGGKDGAAWWFNGQNSYARIDTDRNGLPINWTYQDAARTLPAAMLALVRNNKPHGVAVDFWVDSIEPQFQQVVCEIHSVIRLVVTTDGHLAAYVRDGEAVAAYAATSLHIGEFYQTPVISTFTVQPGKRYSVQVLRANGGASVSIYLSGQLDATVSTNPNSTSAGVGDSHPVGAITIGAGSYEHMIRGPSSDSGSISTSGEWNTDHRSHFCGRVESFKIITSTDAVSLVPPYKAEDEGDWLFPEGLTYRNPIGGNRKLLEPSDLSDTIRNTGEGSISHLSGHTVGGHPLRYSVSDSSTSPQLYVLHQDTITLAGVGSDRYGHLLLQALGGKFAHALCYYRFTADDRDILYGGAYGLGVERRYNGGTAATASQDGHPTRSTHTQESAVVDDLASLGGVLRHCTESDIANDSDTALFSAPRSWTHRKRPYVTRSPKELGPKWCAGMVAPLPGQAPVSLLAEWRQQQGGRRFLIAASGRSIYWVRTLWEPDSPFSESPKWSVWLNGGYGSHIMALASAATFDLTGTANKNTIVFEAWLKPIRLDGRRLIVSRSLAGLSQSVTSWAISTNEGSIEVMGTMAAGTRTWAWTEGAAAGGATAVRPSHSLLCSTWNHLHVTLETSGITVRVNGALVPMVDRNSLAAGGKFDSYTGAASDQGSAELYLGGLPIGRERQNFAVVAGAPSFQLRHQSWCGLMAQVRILDAVEAAWPANKSGYPPRVRAAADAHTLMLLPLNDGEGWAFANQATLYPGEAAHSQIRELEVIKEDLEDSSRHRYSSLVYRDRLIVSNGQSRPQQVRFTSLSAAAPLVVEQVGVLPPYAASVVMTGTTTAGATVTAATYRITQTFLTFDGKESDPTEIGSFVQGSAVATLTITVTRMPRSHDPQVVARRLYVSVIGGGDPVLNVELQGNDSYQQDLEVVALVGSPESPGDAGSRLPAPRGRHLAVAGSSLVVGDLTDEPAGQNAFAFSDAAEPSYFTLASTATIDSQDGKPLVGIRGNLGQVFLSKRDSIYQVSVGSIVTATEVEASLRLVFAGDGVGGAAGSTRNLLYGTGDRGAFVFDNTSATLISEDVEQTWNDEVDRSDAGLIAQQGYIRRQSSEYWVSYRRQGESTLDRILVASLMDQGVAWSLLTVPRHITIAGLAAADEQSQLIVMGTDSGSILRYDEERFLDGTDHGATAHGATTISGSGGLSGSSTSLTMAGARFDTILGGLAGIDIAIVHDGVTETRRTTRNTTDTLFWSEPLTGWTAHTSFSIGAYVSRWTSPWLALNAPSREQTVKRIGVEVAPRSGDLTIRLSSIRQGESVDRPFPAATARYEEFTRPMTEGWIQDMPMPRIHHEGHYHRVEFRTEGPETPFFLSGYSLEVAGSRATSHPGRTA